jgi:hypothetical protein
MNDREAWKLIIISIVLLLIVCLIAFLLRNQPVNPCCG